MERYFCTNSSIYYTIHINIVIATHTLSLISIFIIPLLSLATLLPNPPFFLPVSTQIHFLLTLFATQTPFIKHTHSLELSSYSSFPIVVRLGLSLFHNFSSHFIHSMSSLSVWVYASHYHSFEFFCFLFNFCFFVRTTYILLIIMIIVTLTLCRAPLCVSSLWLNSWWNNFWWNF